MGSAKLLSESLKSCRTNPGLSSALTNAVNLRQEGKYADPQTVAPGAKMDGKLLNSHERYLTPRNDTLCESDLGVAQGVVKNVEIH